MSLAICPFFLMPSETPVFRYHPCPQSSLLRGPKEPLRPGVPNLPPILGECMKVEILSTWDIWVWQERPPSLVPCVRGELSSKYLGCLGFRQQAKEGSSGPALTERDHS